MSNSIKISIVIPHYNCVDRLIKLLDSIPSDKRLEVIVVDDHSSIKPSENMIKKYIARGVIFKENRDNKKGAGSARNVGLELASGEYLMFADSDDYFVDGAIAKLLELDFQSDIIFFPPIYKNEDGSDSENNNEIGKNVLDYFRDQNRKSEMLIRCRFHVPWSRLISTKLVRNNGFKFDEVSHSNDSMFSLKTGIKAETIEAYDYPIYVCVAREGSLTTQTSKAADQARREVYINHYFYWRRKVKKSDRLLFGWSIRGDYRMFKQKIRITIKKLLKK